MKKSILIGVVVAVIVVLSIVGVFAIRNKNSKQDNQPVATSNLKFDTAKDMEEIINKIYEKSKNEMYALETREIDLDDEMSLQAYTGLKSKENIETVVVSESMITASAYSLVLVKVKPEADVEAIKKEMVDNVDMRRWICVSADYVYANNTDNLIFMVLASEENAKPQYDAFKDISGGKLGKELVREAEQPDF